MIVTEIHYGRKFIKELAKLPRALVVLAVQKEALFKKNPLHPSLRLHALHGRLEGLWSISITGGYRIIFERMANGDLLFISIGKHDIYRSL